MIARVRFIGEKNKWGIRCNTVYDVTDEEGGMIHKYWIILNQGLRESGFAFLKEEGEVVFSFSEEKISDDLFKV